MKERIKRLNRPISPSTFFTFHHDFIVLNTSEDIDIVSLFFCLFHGGTHQYPHLAEEVLADPLIDNRVAAVEEYRQMFFSTLKLSPSPQFQ